MTFRFSVRPDAIDQAGSSLAAAITDLSIDALDSCDVSMFSSLAGGAAGLTEPLAGQSANELLTAFDTSADLLAQMLHEAAAAYRAIEAQNAAESGLIKGALHP